MDPATPIRSLDPSQPSGSSSPNSISTSSSSQGSYYDFSIELDKTLSSSLYIEFMEWSKTMDVIALIMHQTKGNQQYLWLQRCVGKWQNLLNIDLSSEFDDISISVISLTWRYDGNGVSLGLSNGEIIQYLLENNSNSHNNIIKTTIDNNNKSINNIQWVIDDEIIDDNDDNNDCNNCNNNNNNNNNDLDDDQKYNKSQSNDNDINEINNIMQNNNALLSMTQLHLHDYDNDNNKLFHQSQTNFNPINNNSKCSLLQSVSFIDQTNRFLSSIPSLPKPPRVDFRYKIDPKNQTLQYIMKKQSAPPITRKSQPSSLALLLSSDTNEIQLNALDECYVGKINISAIKPSINVLRNIDNDNDNNNNNQTSYINSSWNIIGTYLSSNLSCISTVISRNNSDLFLSYIHTPILYSRRNEILILCTHSVYVNNLLSMLNKLDRHLFSRWVQAVRSIKSKIALLEDSIDNYKLNSTWQHEFKHNLLIGTPSEAFINYIQKNINITALERGYKQFDQFINEMIDIIQKNLTHIVQELLFRFEEIKAYSLWIERFGCLGLQTKKIDNFIDKLSALYIKLDQLQLLVADSRLNLIAFKDYLMFLSSIHNNEDCEFSTDFNKLNCKRIIAAIDYDLKPSRVFSFLQDSLLPKKDLVIYSLQPWKTTINNKNPLNPLLIKLKKKWKRFDRYSFSYIIKDIRRSSKPILSVLSTNISKSFVVERNKYGLLYLSCGNNKINNYYSYNSLDNNRDITFETTSIFSQLFGINDNDNVYLCCLNVSRTSMQSNQKQSRLVLIASIPQMKDTSSKFVLSDDIWTDDFDVFKNTIKQFPVKPQISNVKICVIEIEAIMSSDDHDDDDDDDNQSFDYDYVDIIQIQFINSSRLAVLAKLRCNNRMEQQTCLLSLNLEKIDLEFQNNIVGTNDYEMGLNELAFDFGTITTTIHLNDIGVYKYIFGKDVDGYQLSVCGPRKLAAISSDPSMDNNKCNRLIVLDINIDDNDSDSDSDADDTDDDDDQSQSYSCEDSDLNHTTVVDID